MTLKKTLQVCLSVALITSLFSLPARAEEEVTDEINPSTETVAPETTPIAPEVPAVKEEEAPKKKGWSSKKSKKEKEATPETSEALTAETLETSGPAPAVIETKESEPLPIAAPVAQEGDEEWRTMRSESYTSSGMDIVVRINPKKGSVYVSPRITFDSNSNIPVSDSVKSLRKLAQELKRKPNIRLRIEGHTDSIGYDQANLELSQKRADQVKTLLIKYGVSEGQLEAIGMGDRHPLAGSSTPEGQELNRRVELKIIGDFSPSAPTTATPAIPARPAVPATPAIPAKPAVPAAPAIPATPAAPVKSQAVIPSLPPVSTPPAPTTQPTTQPTTLPTLH